MMLMKGWKTTIQQSLLIVLDDMVEDMESNKKINRFVAELFLREQKLKISLVFI